MYMNDRKLTVTHIKSESKNELKTGTTHKNSKYDLTVNLCDILL